VNFRTRFEVGDFVEIMSHSRVDGIVIKTTYRAKVLKVNYLPYVNYLVKDLYTPSPPVWVMDQSMRELTEEEEAYHLQARD
jgi:hypothetical protein